MGIQDCIFPAKFSISITIFFLSSALIRFIGLGCIGFALYIKYGDQYDIVGDAVLPALDSIEVYGMPFGSYIHSLLFSTAVVFVSELITGAIGILASKKKNDTALILYMGTCVIAILAYVVQIVLWSILFHFINNGLGSWMVDFNIRYQSNVLLNGYQEKWKDLYSYVGCCGSSGNDTGCPIGDIGCTDIYQSRFSVYAVAYICTFIVCIFCQICSLLATDYTIKKKKVKASKRTISEGYFFLLLSCHYGVLSQLWKLLKETCKSVPKLLSLVAKLITIGVGFGIIITSLRLRASGLLYKSELITFFKQMHFNNNNNMHSALTVLYKCELAIGFLIIFNAVFGIVGSRRKSTTLYTLTFIGSSLYVICMVIATIMWIAFDDSIEVDMPALARKTDTNSLIITNKVMLFFKCCIVGAYQVHQFCYSNVHESVTNLTFNYIQNLDVVNDGVFGSQDNNSACATEILNTIERYKVIFIIITVVGVAAQIVSMICTHLEFLEDNEDNTSETDRVWMNCDRTYYIHPAMIMVLIEISFIVNLAILGVSFNVSRDSIDDVGGPLRFSLRSGLVLVPLMIINKMLGLAAICFKGIILLLLSTCLTVVFIILSFTYMTMASVLMHHVHEYSCTYVDDVTKETKNCSEELKATVAFAVAIAVLEIIAQVVAIKLNDRVHKDMTNPPNSSYGPTHGITDGVYDILFVDRQIFRVNRKLGRWTGRYAIFSSIMMLLEIAFLVLVSLYGFTALLDRTWITSGLHDIQRGTMNVEVLFNFLKISFLVLLPIICINRFIGVNAFINNRIIVLYVNTIMTAITAFYTLICLSLASIVFEALDDCTIQRTGSPTEDCPTRKKTIVRFAVAMLILELLIQIASLVINDRWYKYLKLAEMDDSITEREIKGLFATAYDMVFKRYSVNIAKKLEIAIIIHNITACFLLLIEITFFVLVIVYGLSSALNRDWIERGLDNLQTSADMEVIFQFLSICSVVLVPLIVINRFVAIIAASQNRKTVFIISCGIVGISLIMTIVCLILGSVLLYQEPNCRYTIDNTVYKTCPRMKGTVGIGLAFFIIEFLMQLTWICLSFIQLKGGNRNQKPTSDIPMAEMKRNQ